MRSVLLQSRLTSGDRLDPYCQRCVSVDVPGDVVPAFRKVWGTLLIMWSNEWARIGKEATVV